MSITMLSVRESHNAINIADETQRFTGDLSCIPESPNSLPNNLLHFRSRTLPRDSSELVGFFGDDGRNPLERDSTYSRQSLLHTDSFFSSNFYEYNQNNAHFATQLSDASCPEMFSSSNSSTCSDLHPPSSSSVHYVGDTPRYTLLQNTQNNQHQPGFKRRHRTCSFSSKQSVYSSRNQQYNTAHTFNVNTITPYQFETRYSQARFEHILPYSNPITQSQFSQDFIADSSTDFEYDITFDNTVSISQIFHMDSTTPTSSTHVQWLLNPKLDHPNSISSPETSDSQDIADLVIDDYEWFLQNERDSPSMGAFNNFEEDVTFFTMSRLPICTHSDVIQYAKPEHPDPRGYCNVVVQDHGFEEYVTDIFANKCKAEAQFHAADCLRNQIEITTEMRKSSIEWLVSLHDNLNLIPETLFLAVNIIDRYLSVSLISRDCFPLLGIAALLIASKHEEITTPSIDKLLISLDNLYTRQDVKEMEKYVLFGIGYRLVVPTSFTFLEYFAMCNSAGRLPAHSCLLRRVATFARKLLKETLPHYHLCQYSSSMLGFCAIQVAHEHVCYSLPFFYPRNLDMPRDVYLHCLSDLRTILSVSF